MNKIEVLNQGYELLTELTIDGHPPRKSNKRQFIPRKGNRPPILKKSDEALAYVDYFLLQVLSKLRTLNYGTLKEDLRLDIIIWYPSRRPDLSIELIKDCIEKSGIIKDDRYIREEHIYGFVDKENPRLILRLWRIPPGRIPPF